MNKCFKWKLNDQYATPKNIYNYIVNVKGFTDFNPLCENYDDSLLKIFNCNLFCNPPYSNIEPFVDYMIKHSNKGYKCIMLLPVRSGAKWFRKLYNYDKSQFLFFTQRLHFNEGNSAPFDCMLVVLGYVIRGNKISFINRDLQEDNL